MNGVESGARAETQHTYIFRLHPRGAYHATVEFGFSIGLANFDGQGKPGLFWYLRRIESMLWRHYGIPVNPGDYLVHDCVACRRESDQSYSLHLAFDIQHGWLFDPDFEEDSRSLGSVKTL